MTINVACKLNRLELARRQEGISLREGNTKIGLTLSKFKSKKMRPTANLVVCLNLLNLSTNDHQNNSH